MHYPSPRRADAARCVLLLLAGLTLPAAAWAQRGPMASNPPPAPAAATTPPAARGPAAAATSPAGTAPTSPQQQAPTSASAAPPLGNLNFEPPAAPALPLKWDEFASDYAPKNKPVEQRWLRIRATHVELTDAPPSRENPVFAMPDSQVRGDLREMLRTKFTEFLSLAGLKSRFENLTLIDRDPAGTPLRYYDPLTKKYALFSLPFGKVIYFLAREDSPQGLDFDFAYYSSDSLSWVPSPVDTDLVLPEPKIVKAAQALQVPTGQYIFMLVDFREGPPFPGSTARPVPLYTYVVLLIEEVNRPSTTGLGAPSAAGMAANTFAAPAARGASTPYPSGAVPNAAYAPSNYPNNQYPQNYQPAGGYPSSGQYPPQGGPSQGAYQPSGGYGGQPPAGYQPQPGQYPQQGNYPPPTNYPPPGNYQPPANNPPTSYPPSGGYPPTGYPPPAGYPPSTSGF